MKKVTTRILCITLSALILISGSVLVSKMNNTTVVAAATNTWEGRTPKYIFLFIGDGMSYPQIAAASDYLGTLKYEGEKVASENLEFSEFPYAGTATTYDSTSFCPDSASTATSISSGQKTNSGVINMDEQKKVKYTTISEILKTQLGYKVGIVSSVSIDHATPAAFYAHQPTRSNYYEIALELANSGFEYFGGGGFLQPTGKNKDQKDVLEVAKENGYTVVNTKEEILGLNSKDKKVIAINPELDNSSAMPYEIDREAGDLALSDYVRKGIDVLFNDKGFFMMVEGGKIDWSCHANDAMTAIEDTIAFDEAVQEAISFYEKYPNDTLIIVTADHETGGLAIGWAGTGYSTYLDKLSEQTMSYAEFNEKVASYRTNKTSFDIVLADVKENFGLMTKTDKDAEANTALVISDYEYSRLEDAYKLSMIEKSERELNEEQKLLYGGYEPLSVTLTHILNNKAGIGWTSYSHTAVPVGVFAKGIGAELFTGYYDNTDIFVKLNTLTKTK